MFILFTSWHLYLICIFTCFVWAYMQTEAAAQFLNVMGHYLESLCSDLRSHAITSVQSNNDRVCSMNQLSIDWKFLRMYVLETNFSPFVSQVSILMKDSFISSFPIRDRAFVKVKHMFLFNLLSNNYSLPCNLVLSLAAISSFYFYLF